MEKLGEGRKRPSPSFQHLRGGCRVQGSAAGLAQVFPVLPPTTSSTTTSTVGTAGRQAPAGGKLAGETGRGAGEKAARCGAQASAKVTWTSGGHGLFVLGPEGRREGPAGPASPESLGEPLDPRQERWIHSAQTSRGTELGRAGGPGPA